MKRYTLFLLAVCSVLSVLAQTARTFKLPLADGQAEMVCFLPEQPSGRAIVGIPVDEIDYNFPKVNFYPTDNPFA